MIALLSHEQFLEKQALSGMTQEQLAEELGVTDRYIRMMCKKDKNVSLTLYANICNVFSLNFGDMIVFY